MIATHIAGFCASPLAAFVETPPWQLTQHAAEIVAGLLSALSKSYRVTGDIAVHRTALVEAGAMVKGPVIIGPDCFVSSGALVRGGCWLDERCIIGPGAELKSSFLFKGAKLAHFNFVGDSMLGEEVNLEAGSIIANYRNEWAYPAITFRHEGQVIRIGANAVVAPGAILAPGTMVKRLALVDQGVAPAPRR
jgi:NDP-sugar pyrophosphorylase family protein